MPGERGVGAGAQRGGQVRRQLRHQAVQQRVGSPATIQRRQPARAVRRHHEDTGAACTSQKSAPSKRAKMARAVEQHGVPRIESCPEYYAAGAVVLRDAIGSDAPAGDGFSAYPGALVGPA